MCVIKKCEACGEVFYSMTPKVGEVCPKCRVGATSIITSEKDIISHPKHYTYSKFEPKDVIREWGLNFNLGSAIKYISRAGRKGDKIEDLQKAVQFLEFEIEALEKEE